MKIILFTSFILFELFATSQTVNSFKINSTIDGTCIVTLNDVEMHIDPATGGRISALQNEGRNFLTGQDKHETYWGSTFWVSPQKIWNSPNMAMLDREPYNISIKDDRVILKSKIDSLTNISFQKEVIVDLSQNAFVLNYIVKNNSTTNIKFAPWEVTRVGVNGISFFPRGAGNVWGSMEPFTKNELGLVWFDYDSSALPEKHNKFFSDGSEGWLAHVNDSMVFIKVFDDMSLEQAAPQEAEIEVYTNPKKTYVEVEVQGPFVDIKPGNTSSWKVKWYLRKFSGIHKNADKKTLVDFVRTTIAEKNIKLN
jgi:hypothetical protein